MSIGKYLNTIRYLRAKQMIYQVRNRLGRRALQRSPSRRLDFRSLLLDDFVSRPTRYLGAGRFCFLNHTADLGEAIQWRADNLPKLWQYNLHYFDFLFQPELSREEAGHLIRHWIENHPPERGAVGWEPYPISLRVVNWLKFLNVTKFNDEKIVSSLTLQGENLERQIEYHILGNHLFANGKALWFLGRFLQNDDWVRLGKKIVLKELGEQFLPDGGHFELSPMYHALMLEDLLDLMNLEPGATQSATRELQQVESVAQRALGWLERITGANGEIPLLNDSAHGVAPSTAELRAYATRLGVACDGSAVPSRKIGLWTASNLSGYWILEKSPFRILFDTALLGPDYLPGHAHGDMLSVLLDFEGQPILTDTGVLEYAEGAARDYSRRTTAHNCVTVDGLDQAEFWKSFRVGRRGHPKKLRFDSDSLSCAHDGFQAQGNPVLHTRRVRLLTDGFEIRDEMEGKGDHTFEANFHFEPTARLRCVHKHEFTINDQLRLTVSGAVPEITTSPFYPEYGICLERPRLVLRGVFSDKTTFSIKCTFSS